MATLSSQLSALSSGRVVRASAPVRADLAGGTLDLWPLYLFYPGSVTVNVALNRRSEVLVRAQAGAGLLVRSKDLGTEAAFSSTEEAVNDPRFGLAGLLLGHFGVSRGVAIEMASAVPFGSGLGGSSALGVALAAAIARFAEKDGDAGGLVPLLRDLEARVLGKPTGVQDFYPAVYGGLSVILLDPGEVRRERVGGLLPALAQSLLFFDTRFAHTSGMNNWEVFRRRLEGDAATANYLEAIRDAAREVARAARAGDLPAIGAAIAAEWEARRQLGPFVSTPLIEKALATARLAGAWGGKACGAGGGGVVLMLAPPERVSAVRAALAALGEGAFFDAAPAEEGLSVTES